MSGTPYLQILQNNYSLRFDLRVSMNFICVKILTSYILSIWHCKYKEKISFSSSYNYFLTKSGLYSVRIDPKWTLCFLTCRPRVDCFRLIGSICILAKPSFIEAIPCFSKYSSIFVSSKPSTGTSLQYFFVNF